MGQHTIQEILSQPEAWKSTLAKLESEPSQLEEIIRIIDTQDLFLVGCGSSHYLSLTVASLYTQLTGIKATGVPASEIITFPNSVIPKRPKICLIGVSRSGTTPETREAASYCKTRGGTVLAVSCTPGSPLLDVCGASIVTASGAESSRYMTRSFTSMLLALQYMSAMRANDMRLQKELLKLPELGLEVINRYRPRIEQLATEGSFNQYVYLGQGPFYGLCCESMLKIKEMACTPSEAFHTMEFMHGPKYAVNDRTLVTVLLSDGGSDRELDLLPKIKTLGPHLLVICERKLPQVSDSADLIFDLNCGLSEYARPLLVMLITQLYAYYRARAIGREIE
jgi:glucosamine--fructose-6-phosphate aminotransferase (isomerizing)